MRSGRDYDEITRTWSPEVFIREDEAEIVAGGTRSFWGEPFESWRDGNLVGTPEQVAEKLAEYRELGCSGFVPWCSDYPEDETLRLLATKVMPEFRYVVRRASGWTAARVRSGLLGVAEDDLGHAGRLGRALAPRR